MYLGLVGTKPTYVGITSQPLNARLREHNARRTILGKPKFSRLKPVTLAPVSRNEARAIETLIIMANPHFDNKYKSIAGTHDIFQGAVNWAVGWCRSNGAPICY